MVALVQPQLRCAVYLRISDTDDERGVSRQRADAEAWCAREGWVPTFYIDNDLSAWSGRRRPEWDSMLNAIRSGAVDVLLCWKLDRLTRRGVRGITPVLELIAEHHVRLVSMTEAIDTSTAMGEAMVALLASVAKQASDDTSLRVRRANDTVALSGQPHPGGRYRPFGYGPDKRSVVEAEADAVRAGYSMLLRGETLHAIAHEWTRRGVLTVSGNRWRSGDVRAVLRSPRYAALRVHRGEVIGSASWPPVVSEETWRAARAMLDARSRGPRTAPARRHVLAGMLRCPCGAWLLSGVASSGKTVYRCKLGGPGHVSVVADEAEREALDALWSVLKAREAEVRTAASATVRALQDDDAVSAAVAKLEVARARLTELEAMFADGDLTRPEYVRMRQRAQDRVAESESALRAIHVPAELPSLADLRASWDYLTVDERRSVLRRVFARFDVPAVGRGTRRRRLVPVPRE